MRYTQPQSGPAQIDWSNPLTRGLDFAWLASLPGTNLASQRGGTKVGVLVYAPTKQGIEASSFAAPSGSNRLIQDSSITGFAGTGSFIGGGIVAGSGAALSIGTAGEGVRVGVNGGMAACTYMGVADYTSTIAVANGPAIVGASISSGSARLSVMAGGAYLQQTKAVGAPIATTQCLRVGTTGSADIWPGSLGFGLHWTRALSDAEMRSVMQNPYQLFKSPQRGMIASAVAASSATASPAGVTATASTGTATASGAARATPLGVTASATVGSATATGSASASPVGVSATAAIGTATATGSASAALVGVTASGAVGSAIASGAAAASPLGVTATASVGAASAIGGSVNSIPATASPSGVGATASVGAVTASGGATASPAGVAATATVGQAIAAGTIIVSATATPAGVTAYGLVGIAAARAGVAYARAPAGNGYSPKRNESQSRPVAAGGSRPAAIQRNNR